MATRVGLMVLILVLILQLFPKVYADEKGGDVEFVLEESITWDEDDCPNILCQFDKVGKYSRGAELQDKSCKEYVQKIQECAHGWAGPVCWLMDPCFDLVNNR